VRPEETDGERDAQRRMRKEPLGHQREDEPERETARYVDHERLPGERTRDVFADETAERVARDRAEETCDADPNHSHVPPSTKKAPTVTGRSHQRPWPRFRRAPSPSARE